MSPSPTSLRVDGTVNAPASTVWAVMADLTAMPDWTPTITKVTIKDPQSPIGVGTRVRLSQPRLTLRRG